jgi:hypothetical protein
LALNACANTTPPSAYQTLTDPEALMMMASDMVTIDLGNKNYTERLGDALTVNPPNRAILNCKSTTVACKKAKTILSKNKISTESTDNGNNVTLVYDRVAARDCTNRYIDNSQNPNNLNYAAFGCSISANIAQMVSDKKQITNPNLLDYQDGEKAASTYSNYVNPPVASSSSSSSSSQGTSTSLLQSSGSQ